MVLLQNPHSLSLSALDSYLSSTKLNTPPRAHTPVTAVVLLTGSCPVEEDLVHLTWQPLPIPIAVSPSEIEGGSRLGCSTRSYSVVCMILLRSSRHLGVGWIFVKKSDSLEAVGSW